MCNLYRMTKATAEIAHLFVARAGQGANFAAEVYPGYPGLVVAEGEARMMTWGFPLALKGKSGQALKPKPVNNAREDKLGTAFWRASFERRRCLRNRNCSLSNSTLPHPPAARRARPAPPCYSNGPRLTTAHTPAARR